MKEGWSWLHCPLLYNLCILSWAFWAFTFDFFPGNFIESDERFYICAQFWIVIPSVIFQSALPNPIRREGTVFEGKMLILEIFSFVQCLIWGHQKLNFYSKYSLICNARPNKLDLRKYIPDFRWDIKNEKTLSFQWRT